MKYNPNTINAAAIVAECGAIDLCRKNMEMDAAKGYNDMVIHAATGIISSARRAIAAARKAKRGNRTDIIALLIEENRANIEKAKRDAKRGRTLRPVRLHGFRKPLAKMTALELEMAFHLTWHRIQECGAVDLTDNPRRYEETHEDYIWLLLELKRRRISVTVLDHDFRLFAMKDVPQVDKFRPTRRDWAMMSADEIKAALQMAVDELHRRTRIRRADALWRP